MPRKASSGQIVVNVENDMCRAVLFRPTEEHLRATITAAKVGRHQKVQPALQAVEEIPGHQLRVDFDKGQAVLHDRFGDREYEPRRRELLRQLSGPNNRIFDEGAKAPPAADIRYDLRTSDDKATWMYWLRRGIDEGDFQLVKGELPQMNEILVEDEEGRRYCRYGNIRLGDTYGYKAARGEMPLERIPKAPPELDAEAAAEA